MTPTIFVREIMDPGLMLLHTLGGPPVTDPARQFLLTAALQENGPQLNARYQDSPSATPGAAKGWWQFEQGGGVTGVLNHAASSTLAKKLCDQLSVQPHPAAVWRALEGHDLLAAAFARLLLCTDPNPIPTTYQQAWGCYYTLWRPGAPHPETWSTNWQTAQRTLQQQQPTA